jgi:hypothetical protein
MPRHRIPLRLLALLLAAIAASGSDMATSMDNIPDYGAAPTIASVGNGAWSNAASWAPARIPADGDVVLIAAGTTISYDVNSSARISVVKVAGGGALNFRTDVSTGLLVANLQVAPGGTLTVGTTTAPVVAGVTASILIADQPIDTVFDPSQYGTGIVGEGTIRIAGVAMTSTFVRLAAEPLQGATTLTLAQPVGGWSVGDRLILPDSQAYDAASAPPYIPQWEELQLAGISADGLTLTLAAPLAFDHLGAHAVDGTLLYLPHVADFTRNVVIASQNPAGTRGHVLFTDRADVDVRYARFDRMGRTTNDPLDSTTFDANGNVTHIGTNQIGRYALHAHHLFGPATPRADGYQFSFVGNAMDGDADVADARKWAIDVHNSFYGLIQANVVYNAVGAGIATEDGSESYNLFDSNFVARVGGTGLRNNDGTDGQAMWFHGPNNSVTNNVVTDVYGASYGLGYTGYAITAPYLGVMNVPAFRGADPTVVGGSVGIDMNHDAPLTNFSDNEAYGLQNGMTVWWLGTFFDDFTGNAGTVRNLHVWNQVGYGFFSYETCNFTLDGFVDIGDQKVATNPYSMATGIHGSDYGQQNLTIVNARIEGEPSGINIPSYANGILSISNSVLRNWYDIIMNTPTSTSGPVMTPLRVEVSNVLFGCLSALPTDQQPPIDMIYLSYANYPVVKDELVVTGFNGVAGDNFQVYYNEQSPDFIVPQGTYPGGVAPNVIGSPEAGLTNAQNWAKYGIAIAGAVLPSGTITRNGIIGQVLPLAASTSTGTTTGGSTGTATGGSTGTATGGSTGTATGGSTGTSSGTGTGSTGASTGASTGPGAGPSSTSGGGGHCGLGGSLGLVGLGFVLWQRRRSQRVR